MRAAGWRLERRTPGSLASLGTTIPSATLLVVSCDGYFFTASKLLKLIGPSCTGPRFLRAFPQASTGKTYRPQLLHKGEMFFCCGAQHSVSEWVQRKRGSSQSLPNDDCGDAGGSWQFSRVNCQGKFGNARECEPVARALRPPLRSAVRSGLGCWLLQGLQRNDSQNHILRIMVLQPDTGKSGTLHERCRTSTVDSPLLAAGRQEERSTNDAARDGWSRAAFVFWGGVLWGGVMDAGFIGVGSAGG
jgi:hypothetical protein